MPTPKEERSAVTPFFVRGEAKFHAHEVLGTVADLVNDDARIPSGDKHVGAKYLTATEKINTAQNEFSAALDRFMELERKHGEAAKRASGSVRESAEKLAQGLARIEKQANFTRLEQYVTLLERAAVAMKTLAELEATGKLDKIAGALR